MKKHLPQLAAIASTVFLSTAGAHAATLIHAYDFNLDSSDSIGNAHGQLIGNAVIQDGELVLDGQGSFLQFNSGIVPTLDSYSFSFDVTRTIDQPNQYVEYISQGNSSAGLFFGTIPNGQTRMGLHPSSNLGPQAWNTGAMAGPLGEQVQYTITYDHSLKQSKLFVNGQLLETYALSVGLGAIEGNTRLGAQYESHGEYFAGRIDNFKVFEGALTAKEVSQLAAPVPEPSTYAMVLVGLATVALSRRATRKA